MVCRTTAATQKTTLERVEKNVQKALRKATRRKCSPNASLTKLIDSGRARQRPQELEPWPGHQEPGPGSVTPGSHVALAEFENDLIRERIMAGLAAARRPRAWGHDRPGVYLTNILEMDNIKEPEGCLRTPQAEPTTF